MVDLHDIQRTAQILHGNVEATPCAHSRTLSEITGAEVFIKFENLQFTGSFKERGALSKLLSLTPEHKAAGIIAMSAGNHAQAVAHHAQRLGIPAVIVMPRFTPSVKVEHTRAFGPEVILHGESLEEAAEFTRTAARERGLHLVHPYDDERVIAGQGTVAIEMLEACPDLEILLVPVGGGGLIAGCAIAAKGLEPDIEVIGVQAERFPSMRQAIEGTAITCGNSTIAEGIAVKQPGSLTLPIVRERVDEILLVTEIALEEAVLLFLDVEKTVAEGAGAAGLAALLHYRDRFVGRKVGVVLSGGNIDLMVLSSIIQRGLVRSGRLVKLRVAVRDVAGALADVSRCIGEADASIVDVFHHRAFASVPVASAEVEFVLQTRGLDHVALIRKRLTEAGYELLMLGNERGVHESPARNEVDKNQPGTTKG